MNNKTELISSVLKEKIFENIKYQEGFIPVDINIINNIQRNQTECIRSLAELDYTHKQIVSYVIFIHNNTIFLMERSPNASEKKLKNKLSIGIGGHLNKNDLKKDIISWGMREFHEEVNYHDSFEIKLIGVINDESNDVGKLHLGIIYLMQAHNNKINIKSELKSGKLISLDECFKYYDQLEPWSQLGINFIKNKNSASLCQIINKF